MSIPRKEMDAALKCQFVPGLRALGFKGAYPHFLREGTDRMELIGIQFSQWGAQFYVELGFGDKNGITAFDGKFIPGNKLKHYHTLSRERLGETPFDYERDGVAVAAQKVANLIPQISNWFAISGT